MIGCIYPVPGDWHIMKTAAEVLKYVMMEGLKSLRLNVVIRETLVSGKIFTMYYWQHMRL